MKFDKYILNDKASKYGILNAGALILCFFINLESIFGLIGVYVLFVAPILSIKGINIEIDKFKEVKEDKLMKIKLLINILLNSISIVLIAYILLS